MVVENCKELKTAKEVKYTMVNLHNEMLDYPLETSQRENYNDTNRGNHMQKKSKLCL